MTSLSCRSCPQSDARFVCAAGESARARIDSVALAIDLPAAALLFGEGEESRGVLILCSGAAKITASSARGRTVVTRMAKPGELLGAPAALLREPHAVSAETITRCCARFVRHDDFVRLMNEFAPIASAVLLQLSREVRESREMIRSLGLSDTADGKLARLLVSWGDRDGVRTENGLRLAVSVSAQMIGEMIGASRQTARRTLSDLRRLGIIEWTRSALLIRNVGALARRAAI